MDLSGLTSVTTASAMLTWLSENCITPIRPVITGSDIGVILQKIVSVGGDGASDLVLFDTKTDSYTLVLTDKAIDISKATATTLTVPANAAVAFPVGTQILLTQSGAGQTTIAAASGVAINSAGGKLGLRTQYSGATLIKRATDTWWLTGDIA